MIPFSGLLGSKRQTSNTVPPGDLVYAPAAGGTMQFTVPDGLWVLSALIVACGGNGLGGVGTGQPGGQGGAGGDLRWANNVPVTPGEVLTLEVAATPSGTAGNGKTAGISRILRSDGSVILQARPGVGGSRTADLYASTARGTKQDGMVVGGGNGGLSADTVAYSASGGGGSGGYSGDGGRGLAFGNSGVVAPTGGAGAGGDSGGTGNSGLQPGGSRGGGGVGAYGEGSSGGGAGAGGSGGGSGDTATNAAGGTSAGSYGGGGGAFSANNSYQRGGASVIRLLWGQGPNNGGRAFPATNVASSNS